MFKKSLFSSTVAKNLSKMILNFLNYLVCLICISSFHSRIHAEETLNGTLNVLNISNVLDNQTRTERQYCKYMKIFIYAISYCFNS